MLRFNYIHLFIILIILLLFFITQSCNINGFSDGDKRHRVRTLENKISELEEEIFELGPVYCDPKANPPQLCPDGSSCPDCGNVKCACSEDKPDPDCSYSPDFCKNGVAYCECNVGYSGDNCDIKDKCKTGDLPDCTYGKITGYISEGCNCECNVGYGGDNCDKKECKIDDLPDCKYGKITGYISEGCNCECDPGSSGKNCDNYDCSMLVDELKKINHFQNKTFIKFSNNNKTITFDMGYYNPQNHRSPSDADFPNYIGMMKSIIDNHFIEKILDCYSPTNIIIDLSSSGYYDSLIGILTEIFDRISNYDNGIYLKYIEIIDPVADYGELNKYYDKYNEISNKYYSRYKGVRNISSDDEEEFKKLPRITKYYGGLKDECPFKQKLSAMAQYEFIMYRSFPLEYFADCRLQIVPR